jgi:L-rhamnose-H+ transport protein
MAPSLSLGIALALLAGLMSGNCMLPMKFTRNWKWENTWLVFSLVSLVVLPWALALGLVGHLFDAYRGLSLIQLAVPFFLGAGWGIAQVLFGISVQRLGLGLAYAIIVGLGAALGTLVPLFTQHRSQVGGVALLEVLAGVVIMAIGIGLSTWGGQIRERPHCSALQSGLGSGYTAAVLLAILCGLLAPMLNYSLAFGQDIAQQASHVGNTALRSAYAVWPIGLGGGLLPNVAYSLHLLRKNKSWKFFQVPAPDVFWSILMGVLWMGAFALYGMSATYLGSLGTSIGWGLFQIFMIMTATLSGVLMGEWKGAPRSATLRLGLGLGSLTCATALLSLANR